MTAPTFRGIFPHNWTAEILPNRPMILPNRHYVYPAQVEEVERGALEVLVQPGTFPESSGDLPNEQSQFLATCALGFRDPSAPTGIWSMPDPDWLCAVSGGYAYLIDVAEPERFTMLRYRPVLEVLSYTGMAVQSASDKMQSAAAAMHSADANVQSPAEILQSADADLPTLNEPRLLFVGHHSVMAWGRAGEAWESDRLSSEGITNLRIEGTHLLGEGWDLMTDKELPFSLDLATGKRV